MRLNLREKDVQCQARDSQVPKTLPLTCTMFSEGAKCYLEGTSITFRCSHFRSCRIGGWHALRSGGAGFRLSARLRANLGGAGEVPSGCEFQPLRRTVPQPGARPEVKNRLQSRLPQLRSPPAKDRPASARSAPSSAAACVRAAPDHGERQASRCQNAGIGVPQVVQTDRRAPNLDRAAIRAEHGPLAPIPMRNPVGQAGISRHTATQERFMSVERSLGIRARKDKPAFVAISARLRSRARAGEDSGTRCVLRCFVWADGFTQTPLSRSN